MKALVSTAAGVLVALAGAFTFLFSMFATLNYVDAKHDAVQEQLKSMQQTLNVIDQRTWEMRGREGIPPRHLAEESR